MPYRYDPTLPYEQQIQGLLTQSEEDDRMARGLGALTAGLGVLSAPRNRNFLPYMSNAMLSGINVYQDRLDAATNQKRNMLGTITALKKVKDDEEKRTAYKTLFSGTGEPDWKQAMAIAAQHDDIPAMSAFAARAAQPKLQFVPANSTIAYDPSRGTFEQIPGTTQKPEGVKPTDAAKRRAELIEQGYDPDVATSVAYGAYHNYTTPSGGFGIYDWLSLGGPRSTPSYGGSDLPKSGGARVGAARPPYAPETPPVSVEAAPNEGWGSPQDTHSAKKNRFAAETAPPGAMTFTPGRKPTVEFDKAVSELGEKYKKTGIEQMDTLRGRLTDLLSDYIDIDQKGNWNVKADADIPGMGLTGRPFPQQMLGDKGKAISQVVQDIINQKLYDLSGKAVTSNEWERFLRAVGGGAFMKDADLVRGLKSAMDAYDSLRTSVMAGANPEVLQAYMKQKADVEAMVKGDFTGMMDEMGREIDPDTMTPTGRVFKQNKNGSYVRVK